LSRRMLKKHSDMLLKQLRYNEFMTEEPLRERPLFEVRTLLGFSVRTTKYYWGIITTIKHPSMRGKEGDVQDALKAPDEIRRSKKDPTTFLFYKSKTADRWVCAVAKKLNGEGFLITAYPTDNIKEGEQIWPR